VAHSSHQSHGRINRLEHRWRSSTEMPGRVCKHKVILIARQTFSATLRFATLTLGSLCRHRMMHNIDTRVLESSQNVCTTLTHMYLCRHRIYAQHRYERTCVVTEQMYNIDTNVAVSSQNICPSGDNAGY